MKYEMVFGDDGLFFDAQKDCEMVGNGHHKVENGKLMVWNFTEKRWCNSHTNTITISAMRRIIAEPKSWTLEDKRAGRMPEVGSRVDFCHKLNTNWRTGEIKYIDNQVAVIKADDIDRPFVYEFDRVEFKPVETPDEKAVRLREEWCIKALSSCSILLGMQKYELKRFGGYIEDIYDALLSGDIPVPSAPEQNK